MWLQSAEINHNKRRERGLPRYDIPKDSLPAPVETQALMPDSAGRVVALGGPVTSIASDGSENWTYRNEWPGLHAGHRTTARGDEPGVLIAPTRIWGMARTRGDAGEVVCFNSNLGCAYLMTAEDGLFIDRVFRDQRVVPTVWNFDVVPDSLTAGSAIFSWWGRATARWWSSPASTA